MPSERKVETDEDALEKDPTFPSGPSLQMNKTLFVSTKHNGLGAVFLSAVVVLILVVSSFIWYWGVRVPQRHFAEQAAIRRTRAPGGIALRTVPAGATVLIDGKTAGVTPLDLGGYSPGRHLVELTLAGWESWRQDVSVSSDRFTVVDEICLIRSKGRLLLRTAQKGVVATVLPAQTENNAPVEPVASEIELPASLTLPTGGYEVRFGRDGARSQTACVSVLSGSETAAVAKFPEGRLSITSFPSDLEYQLESGEAADRPFASKGRTPAQLVLPTGRYVLKVISEAPEPLERTVEVAEDTLVTADLSFCRGGLEIVSTPDRLRYRVTAEAPGGLTQSGLTPVVLSVPVGTYQVEVLRMVGEPLCETVQVLPGRRVKVEANRTPEPTKIPKGS